MDEPDTGCVDCVEEGHFGSTETPVTDAAWDGSASRFTDEQYRRAAAACDPGAGGDGENDPTVKAGCFAPHHEPDGRTNSNGVHAAAGRINQVKGHAAAVVERAKAHLRSHYRQMGEDAPDSIAAAHAVMPVGMSSFVADASPRTAGAEDTVVLVAAALASLGASWGIAQREEDWAVLAADGSVTWTAGTYAEAVARLGEELASSDSERPVLAETWRSDMAFEGVDTGDGRYIRPGAIDFRPTPLPLMLQTTTDVGHFGAVLAGTITATGMMGTTAIGSGSFDDNDAGRQFLEIINARGRFGVSIDVAEADGEFVCTETDADGDCIDGRVEFDRIVVMGETGTPFPAFTDAYIEVAANAPVGAVTASGNAQVGGSMHVTDPSLCVTDRSLRIEVLPLEQADALVAAGGPARPPLGWFSVDFENDPVAAAYLVRQPDGSTLCPLTVLPDGRVFGHFAGWQTCHTAYASSCVQAPRSRSGYAAFHLRPLETEEGEIVQVGHITMGCGHIEDDGRVPIDVVRAHYDGGPGAVLMARVRAGEDRFGGWFAGALAENVTDEAVRRFSSLSVSGHWREVWRGKGLDLLACLAGVPVPGFPVSSAMAAAGYVAAEVDEAFRLPSTHVAWNDGRVVALVAAGVVRQPQPWERQVATLQRQLDSLSARLEAAERVAGPLRPLAAGRTQESILAAAGNGSASE